MNQEPSPEGFLNALLVGYLALRTYIELQEHKVVRYAMTEHGLVRVVSRIENIEGHVFYEVLAEDGKHILPESEVELQKIEV